MKSYVLNLVKKLLKFSLSTTDLCEVKFSSYISTKTIYHIRLNGEDVRIWLSSMKPDIKESCSVKCHVLIFLF